MITQKNKYTYLTTKLNYYADARRYYPGNTSDVNINNAFYDVTVSGDTTAINDAVAMSLYIDQALNENMTFSTILKTSHNTLGYTIHKDSLVLAVEDLLTQKRTEGTVNEIKEFLNKIWDLDDFGHFQRLENNDLELIAEYRVMIESTMDTANTENVNQENIRTELSDLEDIKHRVANKSQEPEYQQLPAQSNKSLENSSDIMSNNGIDIDSININNNGEIALLTILAFVTIQAIAYYVRTYHPNTMEESDNTTKNDIQNNTQYSVFEGSVFFDTLWTSFIIYLVPSYIVILYNFRHYYKLKVRLILNKNNPDHYKDDIHKTI